MPKVPSKIEVEVAEAFGGQVHVPPARVVGYERVRLRWLKPSGRCNADGTLELVPKYPKREGGR